MYLYILICLYVLQIYRLDVVDWRPRQSRHSRDSFLFVYNSTDTSRAPTIYVSKQEPRLPIINADGFIMKLLNEVDISSVYAFHIRYIALTEYKKDFLWHSMKNNHSESNSEYNWQRQCPYPFQIKVLSESHSMVLAKHVILF